MDELRQTLLLLTMELEDTRLKAQEELRMRDEQISHLQHLLNGAIKERDEAQQKCQKLFFEKLMLHQSAPHSAISSIEDDPRRGIDGFSSSDCDESIVSSPHQLQPPPMQPPPPEAETELPVVINRALPEKGMLLQAVMKAGPLLQTLLLAGPLPQWRHPPPQLDTYQIPPPPVVVPSPPPLPALTINQDPCQSNININDCGRMNRKRGPSEGSESSIKYQRILLQ